MDKKDLEWVEKIIEGWDMPEIELTEEYVMKKTALNDEEKEEARRVCKWLQEHGD